MVQKEPGRSLAGFLLVWANGAVGLLGDADNPANLMFFGVIAVAVTGALLARLRPAGMARAMLAAMTAQALAGITGLAAGCSAPGPDGAYEVVMGIGLFGGLWLLAASLFRKAAAQMGA